MYVHNDQDIFIWTHFKPRIYVRRVDQRCTLDAFGTNEVFRKSPLNAAHQNVYIYLFVYYFIYLFIYLFISFISSADEGSNYNA